MQVFSLIIHCSGLMLFYLGCAEFGGWRFQLQHQLSGVHSGDDARVDLSLPLL
jgi:hypothetical protein